MGKTRIQEASTEYLECIIRESGLQFMEEREPLTQNEVAKGSIYWQIFEELKIRKNAPNKDI